MILLGNHDVELAYPEVWAVLRAAILAGAPAAGDRLNLIHDRTTYRPNVGGVLVHIEHGNKDDSWNAINYTELFHDAETNTRTFSLPPGTRFVYETMNGVKDELQFVDILKPEVPAVVTLLMALRPWKSMQSLPAGVASKLRSVANGWLSSLRQIVSGPPLGAAPGAVVGSIPVDEALSRELARAYEASAQIKSNPGRVDDVEFFLEADEPNATPGQPTLGGALDATKVRLITAALWTLARFRSSQGGARTVATASNDDNIAASAKGRMVGDVKLVIFGHTHEALKAEFDTGVYVNSGAWANLMQLPSATDYATLLTWTRSLADNTFERVSEPTYVRIEPGRDGATVALCRWGANGEEELWRKAIAR